MKWWKKKPTYGGRTSELERTLTYHRNKHAIPSTVLNTIGKKEVIYGARSVNKQLPAHLRKTTVDYDVYSPTPRRDAVQAERALDRNMGGDYFHVEPAKHAGTYKVVSKQTGEGVADFTRPEKKVPYVRIQGKKYSTLEHEKGNRLRSIRDPDYAFRHAKDKDALNRIRLHEHTNKKWMRR